MAKGAEGVEGMDETKVFTKHVAYLRINWGISWSYFFGLKKKKVFILSL